jgi:hypothetical protein
MRPCLRRDKNVSPLGGCEHIWRCPGVPLRFTPGYSQDVAPRLLSGAHLPLALLELGPAPSQ